MFVYTRAMCRMGDLQVTEWVKRNKEDRQERIFSPTLFSLYSIL